MAQKRKLMEFLEKVPTVVSEQTTQALLQIKDKAVAAKRAEAYATPVFANSAREISSEQQLPPVDITQPVDTQHDNSHIEGELQQAEFVPPLTQPVHSTSVTEDARIVNLNSVLTERSEVEQTNQRPTAQPKKKSKLSEIEEQKLRIQQQLKSIEAEIDHLKEPPKQGGNTLPINTFKKYKEISQDTEAFNNAQKLMTKLHADKRLQQEKRQQQQRQRLQQLQREAIQKQQERQQELDRIKQQRRQQIARRIQEDQRRRQQRRLIDQQSNQLIKEIKKEENMKAKPVSTSLEVRELESKKKLLEKKRNFDLADIEQHQLRYKEMKLQRSIHRSEEPHISMSLPRYPKGKFLQQYEHEQQSKKEQERLREQEKRANVEKRLKYGELVKKIFLPPKPHKKEEEPLSKIKPPTPDVMVNGAFKQDAVTRKTYTNSHDTLHKNSLRQRLPELAKATGSSLSKHVSDGRETKQFISEPQSEEKQRQERQRLDRERQIRRQTKERLKHAEEIQKERKRIELPKMKKYENYLEQMPKHKHNSSIEWKKIIDNDSMSKQQKYKELMNKANLMENKAKFKEEMAGGGHENEQAMNLIIGSIQAKLALLDKF